MMTNRGGGWVDGVRRDRGWTDMMHVRTEQVRRLDVYEGYKEGKIYLLLFGERKL